MLNNLRKLTGYKKLKLDLPLTQKALINTAKSRNSYSQIFEKLDEENYLWQFTLDEIQNSRLMQSKWKNCTYEKVYTENISFQDTLKCN